MILKLCFYYYMKPYTIIYRENLLDILNIRLISCSTIGSKTEVNFFGRTSISYPVINRVIGILPIGRFGLVERLGIARIQWTIQSSDVIPCSVIVICHYAYLSISFTFTFQLLVSFKASEKH